MNRAKYLTIVGLFGLIFQINAFGDDGAKVLYKEVVAPVLSAKCGGCHGEDKQKGKLRVDSLAAMLKGGSEGPSLVPGKPEEGSLLFRIHLPEDDDEHMPPEGKDQMTEDEIAVLEFWIKSGAKEDATIASLKATAEISKSITAVLAANVNAAPKKEANNNLPTITEADRKVIEDTIKKINSGNGGNLMAIAQDTPQLTFSALNVYKEFGDPQLAALKAVGPHILWLNIARTQVTDNGLANLNAMPNLTRLHLEKTAKITDAGLDHIKGLKNLEYLNLYGTGITDAGIAKLASNKNLKKLFLWQTKATDQGVAQLAKAIPGIDINTGWKEPAKPAETKVAAANTKGGAAAAAPAKPPAKPTPKPPVKKAEPKKVVAKAPPAPAKKATPAPAAPAKKPTPAEVEKVKGDLEKALAELKAAAEKAKEKSAAAKSAHEVALKKAQEAAKQAEAMKAEVEQAANKEELTVKALQELIKAVEASKK